MNAMSGPKLNSSLGINIGPFVAGLRNASKEANKFSANLKGQINEGMLEPAKKSKFEFKDVARIVQGILISKVFYTGLNAIRRATNAVWEFSKELEYAQMVYTNLFGNTELANEFINVLKDFAAITPYSFKQSEQAAKRLLAYGIQAQNVMYVMKGVLAASTVQSNPAVIESISRALGQIYTKGRVMNEEMRQLAESGIPVYDILSEKLGLTVEQLRNLGDYAIPANVAINALVDGLTERFGSALDQSSQTALGIISNIKDNSLMLFSTVFKDLTDGMTTSLRTFGDFINELRDVADMSGAGGVFEKLVPPELRETIRTLIVNLMNLKNVIGTNIRSALSFFKQGLVFLAKALNAVLPIVNALLGLLANLQKVLVGNETAMRYLNMMVLMGATAWVVYKTQALHAMVVTKLIAAMTAAFKGLLVVMNFVVAHPIWALFAVGVALLVGMSVWSDKASKSINDLFGGLTRLGGVNPDDMLLPDTKERESDLEKFNNRLSETGDEMENLAKDTGKAAKAAKGLLNFDEVFRLKEPSSASGVTDAADEIADLLTMLNVGDVWEAVDFEGISNGFTSNLLESFGGQEKLLSTGIGYVLGMALGGIIGGPVGAKIGATLGLVAGYIWTTLAEKIGLSDIGTVAIPIGTVITTALGFLMGGPIGAGIGLAVGVLAGWILESIIEALETGEWAPVALPIGAGLGTAIGLVTGGPAGAIVGAAIGALVGWLIPSIKNAIDAGDWSFVGIALGTGIGTAIGFVIGGPVGAVVGAAVGTLVGWIAGLIAENWDSIDSTIEDGIENLTGYLDSFNDFLVEMFSPLLNFLDKVIDKVREFFGLEKRISNSKLPEYADNNPYGVTVSGPGIGNTYDPVYFKQYANGGIVNRDQIARIAEGNKSEAIIPLENAAAMQPFVDAVSGGLYSSLAPLFANLKGGGQQLQPVYVGTLIADEASLRELQKRMEIVQMHEEKRRGN